MTTSDGAQPTPGEQQQPDPAAAAAAANQQQQQQQEPEPVDIDEKDLTDAKAAVEAEKPAGEAGDGTIVDPANPAGQAKPGDAQGTPAKPAGAGEAPVMIPKARLDEALGQRDEKATEAAYWKGRADALAQGQPQPKEGQQQPGNQQQSQGPTPEARLTAIQTEQDALAAKYDNGEISYSDLTKQKRDLDNKEFAIREEILAVKLKPAGDKPADQGADQLYLDTLTAQLETEHPWVQVFDQVGTDTDWKYLRDRAVENLVSRGVDPTKGSLGRYELRKEVATLADQIGPSLIADRAKAKGIAIPSATPSPGGQKTPPSKDALARAAKLGLAADAPPNVNQMGGTVGDTSGLPTEARLESMSEEAIGDLPDAQRRRLLGIT